MFTLLRSALYQGGGVRAAKTFHSHMLQTILKAPISYFDVTPVSEHSE